MIDEHGMVVGQLLGHQPMHHSQGHYPQSQHQHNSRQGVGGGGGAPLILDDGGHYHGPKVMLDHNENELSSASGSNYHRMGAGGGMVNGGGKDPMWRPPRRRRKDEEERGLSAGSVHRLYALPHALAMAPVSAGPYNPQQHPHFHHHSQHHHHNQQPHHAQPPPVQSTHSNNPHPKMPPPASPNQIHNHSSHANASVVTRAGSSGNPATPATNIVLTPLTNPTALLTTATQPNDQPFLIPVAGTVLPPPADNPGRSRRGGDHNAGGNPSSLIGAINGGANAAVPTQRITPVQFDLAASAFPPLPGSTSSASTGATTSASEALQPSVASVAPPTNIIHIKKLPSSVANPSASKAAKAEEETGKQGAAAVAASATDNNPSSSMGSAGDVAAVAPLAIHPAVSAWGDSLADVVKGTAKAAKTPSSTNANGQC